MTTLISWRSDICERDAGTFFRFAAQGTLYPTNPPKWGANGANCGVKL
jgi:hypothetical protein